jgi:hypothetical protein
MRQYLNKAAIECTRKQKVKAAWARSCKSHHCERSRTSPVQLQTWWLPTRQLHHISHCTPAADWRWALLDISNAICPTTDTICCSATTHCIPASHFHLLFFSFWRRQLILGNEILTMTFEGIPTCVPRNTDVLRNLQGPFYLRQRAGRFVKGRVMFWALRFWVCQCGDSDWTPVCSAGGLWWTQNLRCAMRLSSDHYFLLISILIWHLSEGQAGEGWHPP